VCGGGAAEIFVLSWFCGDWVACFAMFDEFMIPIPTNTIFDPVNIMRNYHHSMSQNEGYCMQ